MRAHPTRHSRAVVALGLMVALATAAAGLPTRRIGMVVDGPADLRRPILQYLQPEIAELTQGEFEVRFEPVHQLLADGTPADVRRGLLQLLADDSVDLVIGAGAIASHILAADLAQQGGLAKPCLAPLVIDPAAQGIPLTDGVSGVENLSYTAFPSDPSRDLETLRQVVRFDTVALVCSQSLGEAIPGLKEYYLMAAENIGVEAVIVSGDTPEAILDAVPEGAGALFIPLPVSLTAEAADRLVVGLNERGLPGLSVGMWMVERGLLAGLHTDADMVRLGRRTALNIQRILLGEEAGSLPVLLGRGERLTINMDAVRSLGAYPTWAVMTEAVLINEESEPVARRLTLSGAVNEAVQANLDLAARERTVAAGAEAVREARARLLPQLAVAASGTAIGEDQANAFQAQRTVAASGSASQLLYSEEAWAGLDIERKLQRSRQRQLEELRLDVVEAAAKAYLNLLRSQTLEQVQAENLHLTRRNLELARVRVGIGASGRAEVHRWESEIATARRSLIEANSLRNVAEIAVNRILRRPLEEPFEVEEVGLHDQQLMTHDPRFYRYLESKPSFAILRDFLVCEGLAASPELRQLDLAIGVRERVLTSARRALFLPTVALRGDVTGTAARSGAFSNTPLPGGDATWSLGLSASFPLYSGGGKIAGLARVRQELAELRLQRQATSDLLEQGIRSAAHVAGASYAAISLSQDAAVAAHQNLELVEDAYGRGVVSILDLLDAQNAAILAEAGAASSIYDFLVDLITAERAMGMFYMLADAAGREALFARAEAYYEQAGARP